MAGRRLFSSPSTPIASLSGPQTMAWAACGVSARSPNPFFEPDCRVPGVTYLTEERDDQLVVAESDGEVLACLPVSLSRGGRILLNRPVAHSRLVSTTVGLGTPLVSANETQAAVQALVGALRQWAEQGGPGLLVCDWLDDDEGGVGKMLRASCQAQGMPVHELETWERPVVRRSAEGLSIEAHLSSKRRSPINRRRRRLEEELGDSIVVRDRAQDPRAVDDFIQLEASGWKGEQGGAYARRPEAEQWFRSLCANFATSGRLHLIALDIADRSIAMQCGLRSGSTVFVPRVAHDAALNAYGPGVLGQLATVDYLGGLGVDLIDTCADPRNNFLAGIYPDSRRMAKVIIGTGGAIDRNVVEAIPLLQAARRESARLLTAARQWRSTRARPSGEN
jgi:CelD/BcsL family acetyltransferase involved in cellulose biosynthesis